MSDLTDIYDMTEKFQQILQSHRNFDRAMYKPSPGQIDSHVDHRVATCLSRTLFEEGWSLTKIDRDEG